MMEQNNLTIPGWEDDEYKAFTEKFKAKKTTDDCYTPDNIYDAIAEWVAKEYGLDRADFVRPFFPGGDFENHPYKPTDIVVDNPPFSILAKIKRFYMDHSIRFFLFAPALTLFSTRDPKVCYIPAGAPITYENGAEVITSFVTNLETEYVVRTAPDLYRLIKAENDRNLKEGKKELPKYIYPDNIITAAMVQRWCKYGVDYRLRPSDCLPIDGLESQKAKGASIFGNGFILGSRAAAARAVGERAAAERAAAERAAAERWEISESEKQIIRWIDERTEQP